MAITSSSLLPSYVQYPFGYSSGVTADSSSASATTASTSTASSDPVDIVDIRSRLTGTFTAAASDKFSVSDLFTGTAAKGGSIAGYKVALRADQTGGGQLELDGTDVTSQHSFTADQFSRLHFIAGPSGSSQDLVVVAQSGKRLADGTLANEVDSPAVQITASVTGTRSINAASALLTQPTGSDAAFVGIAQSSTIFSGYGAARPGLTTVGNLTATASDKFSVSDLFTGTAAKGGSIAGYKVALRADQTGGGQLELDGTDVTSQHSFTADQFSRLHFIAGPSGSSQDLVVVAQSGKRLADGTLANEVDSPAVQITASVTGTRSINAASALLTQPTGSDAAFVGIAQSSTIFSGYGAARPGLTTVGNLTATASDKFSVSDLFTGTAAKGGSIAGYKVALRADQTGGGQLELDGTDVTSQHSFTADQFSRLHFIAGPSGSSQDLVVVAQSGKRLADGTLANEVDSPAVQITASVTGTRSINAASALLTQPTGSDAAFVGIAQSSTIFSGYGAARPGLTTVGNLTATASDKFSVSDLFTGTAAKGGSIAGYKVALRADQTGGGQLELDGTDVTSQHSFTADQFSRLHFIAGPSGSSQDLVVVAQSGKRLADGTLANEVDSPAVQITASVTGTRSINAASALLTQPTGSDAAFVGIAQSSTIFSGYGAARPGLTTVGNLTATASDKFSVSDLFTGTAAKGGSIAGYKVALRADQTGGGQLELDGTDVTSQHSFTADQFSRLHFIAGPSGSSQDLVVVAQSGKRLADGTLANEVDSPAVQITASVTGTRSINAASALLTQPTGSDAAFVGIAQSSTIFSGYGAARPTIHGIGDLDLPNAQLSSLQNLLASFETTASPTTTGANILLGFAGTVGGSQDSANLSESSSETALTWALSATELAGYQSTNNAAKSQQLAISAYQSSTVV